MKEREGWKWKRRGSLRRMWLEIVRADFRENGMSWEEVHDQAAWRRISSYINPTHPGGGGGVKMKK